MRQFVVQALVLTMIALAASSFLFRSRRARRTLDYIRDGIVLYVLAVLALGLYTYVRQQL